MGMIERAYLLPSLGKALVWQNGSLGIMEEGAGCSIRAPERGELALIRDVAPAVEGVDGSHACFEHLFGPPDAVETHPSSPIGISLERVAEILALRTDAHDALRYTVTALDRHRSEDSREIAAEAAEESLEIAGVGAFLLNRLTGQPLHARLDLSGGKVLAERLGLPLLYGLLEEVEDLLPFAAAVQAAWRQTRINADLADPDGSLSARLVDLGVFAQCQRGLADRNNLIIRDIPFGFGNDSVLKAGRPQLPTRYLAILANKVLAHLEEAYSHDTQQSVSSDTSAPDTDGTAYDPIRQMILDALGQQSRSWKNRGRCAPTALTNLEAFENANTQKVWIAAKISKQQDRHAEQALRDLVCSQLANGGPAYLAKSLSDLATQCRAANSLDWALRLDDLAVTANADDSITHNGRSETLRALGRLEEALCSYDRTIARFPDDVVAFNGQAETLRALGHFDEALANYNKTIERFPNDVVTLNGRAETLRALGRLDEALSSYAKTIERFPHDVFALNGRAETLRALGHFDEALANYDQTIEQFPSNVVAQTGRAETLRALGRLKEALSSYDRTIERFPDNVVALNGRAETLRALGRLDEALSSYARTIERFPHDVFALNGRAETLRALGRLEEALSSYDQTIEQFPGNVVAQTGRAETLRALGRLKEALSSYDRTVERFPDNVFTQTGRAETLRALGRLDDALVSYEQTIERFPDNVVALNGRAETLRALGRLDDALSAYDRTVEQFPHDPAARCGLAETLREVGRLDDALASYDRTIERFSANGYAHNGRAETLRALGRTEEALQAYKDRSEQSPHDRVTRNAYACLLIQLGRSQEARSLLDTAAPRSLQDWIDMHVVAMSYLRDGQTQAARELLKQGREQCPFARCQPYFKNALAFLEIQEGAFGEAEHLLDKSVPPHLAGADLTNVILFSHVLAATNRRGEARDRLAAVPRTNRDADQVVVSLHRRYALDGDDSAARTMAAADKAQLDTAIRDGEQALILASLRQQTSSSFAQAA